MKIHQLSLFVENKPGHLTQPMRLLADAGLDVRTISLADTEQFGILRLIVADWERAKKTLTDAGYIVTDTVVLAVEVPDRPGGLVQVLGVIEKSATNIEYLYAFPWGRGDQAVIIFRFDDPDAALDVLKKAGFHVLESAALYATE